MNFQRSRSREEPEINLIPLIDVLLVILIFLMVTTSYAKFSELKINLPQAGGEQSTPPPDTLTVSVDAAERYAINDTTTPYTNAESLAAALRQVAGDQQDPIIIIHADAKAPHQAVINIMEAARINGYARITFTTSRQ